MRTFGDDVGVDGIRGPKLAYPCVFDGVDDDGATDTFGVLVQIEILTHRFVEGIIAVLYNISGVIWDC